MKMVFVAPVHLELLSKVKGKYETKLINLLLVLLLGLYSTGGFRIGE